MNALELRRRTLGKGVYKKTVEGNPAIAQGSLARRYLDITMQGWTEQAQYEGKNLFDISDFETNNKGIIENGTILFKQSLGTVTYYLSLSPGTYSISIKRSGYSGIYIKVNEVEVIDNGGSVNFTNNFDVSDGDSVVLEFSEGQNPNGEERMIYDIMLNSGSAPLPYEPYTGGAPSPSPDYPQEITSAGKYDEGTGKYQYTIKISDSEESPTKSQTVTLTSDRPLTKWDRLEKRNGVWGWVYKSAEVVLDGSEDEAWSNYPNFNGFLCSGVLDAIYSRSAGMCNQGAVNQDGSTGIPNTIWLGGNTNTVYFINNSYYNSGLEDEGLQNLKNHLAQSSAIIWYETAEETFVPLSESEQEALNALHTFRPTTVLSNDCNCNMTLTYKTKKSLEVTD